MSRLALKIEAEQLRDRRAAQTGFKMVQVEQDIADAPSHYMAMSGIQSRYRLKAIFGVDIWISEPLTSDTTKGDLIVRALKDTRRAVVNEVFGEFRGILNEIRLASYEMDYDKVRELVSEIQNKMFVEGLE